MNSTSRTESGEWCIKVDDEHTIVKEAVFSYMQYIARTLVKMSEWYNSDDI